MDLQTIWFFLWGLLWAVFFMTDGFDMGIGSLYPFLSRNEQERRVMINAIGPVWDGNQVWLITAGGVTFAAFPQVYAVMFSSLYSALMLILFGLILRGVSFEFRGKLDDPRWRKVWDTCIFLGSVTPAVLFGVAFANIFQGVPIDREGIFQGTLLTLLNPYGLLGGALFLTLFLHHGALWLAFKTEGVIHERARKTAAWLWPVTVAVAVTFLAATFRFTRLYDNYLEQPALFAVVAITVAALAASRLFLARKAFFKAWVGSAAAIVGATFFGVIGLFPNLYPSSLNPRYSLTAFNASSSPLTLKIMLVVVVLFVPVVLAYQYWAYSVFRTKVNVDDLTY
jgi:cytochrome d ubiquinol oxidase subunit II